MLWNELRPQDMIFVEYENHLKNLVHIVKNILKNKVIAISTEVCKEDYNISLNSWSFKTDRSLDETFTDGKKNAYHYKESNLKRLLVFRNGNLISKNE